MEANTIDEAILSSSSTKEDEKSSNIVESVDDLLEECWFFGNLLVNPKPVKSTILFSRCYSDPCPSSSTNIVVPSPLPIVENNTSSSSGGDSRRSLVRAPSLPLNIGREDQEGPVIHEGQPMRDKRESKVKHKPKDEACVEMDKKQGNDWQIRKNRRSNNSKVLTRTQTLPLSMRNVEILDHHDQEGDQISTSDHGKISKSDRRTSLNNLVDILPPRHDHKGTSRYRTPRNTEVELEGIITSNTDGSKDMRRRYLNGRTLRRSTSELEIEEVQGFKDLGFTFDNKDSLSPSVVNILPGLQEKNGEDLELENKVKRPYLSEAWLVQCSGPLPPSNWASTRSSEDMKAQIKFWARSVASNVRLEC